MIELSCATVRELAPELALGVLTGHERAAAHTHLGKCSQCREYVTSLTQISDRLLTLIPAAEPPVGFEGRVLATMGFPARQMRRRRRWSMAVAAAAVAAVVFGIGGWAVGNLTSRSPAPVVAEMRFAQFHGSDHHQVGQVFTYGGSPPWVYMSVTNASATAAVTCQLEERNGAIVSIGSFPLSDGKGFWGQKVPVDPSTVVGARLVTDHGMVLATATFGS